MRDGRGCGAPDYDNNGNSGFSGDPKYVGGAATWTYLIDDYSVTGADADGDSVADDWMVIRSRAQFQWMAVSVTPALVIGINIYLSYNKCRSR